MKNQRIERDIVFAVKTLDNSSQLVFKNINRNLALIEISCESGLITSLDANNRIAEQFILVEKCVSRYLADLMIEKYLNSKIGA